MWNFLYLSNFDAVIKGHMSGLQSLTIRLQQIEIRIEDYENEIKNIHNAVRKIEFEKGKVIRRFSILREFLAPTVVILRKIGGMSFNKESLRKFCLYWLEHSWSGILCTFHTHQYIIYSSKETRKTFIGWRLISQIAPEWRDDQ